MIVALARKLLIQLVEDGYGQRSPGRRPPAPGRSLTASGTMTGSNTVSAPGRAGAAGP